MKSYNIRPEERKFDWGTMAVVSLGERGRGRHEEVIPFHAPTDSGLLEIGQTKSGKPKIVASQSSDGWLAVVSGGGTYTRGTYGTCYCLPADRDKLTVVGKGSGAYGDAGRIGDWNEFLVIIPDGSFVKVRPAGGSGKIERYWLYFAEDKVYRVEKSQIDIFCDARGLDTPPEEFDNLVDLSALGVR